MSWSAAAAATPQRGLHASASDFRHPSDGSSIVHVATPVSPAEAPVMHTSFRCVTCGIRMIITRVTANTGLEVASDLGRILQMSLLEYEYNHVVFLLDGLCLTLFE